MFHNGVILLAVPDNQHHLLMIFLSNGDHHPSACHQLLFQIIGNGRSTCRNQDPVKGTIGRLSLVAVSKIEKGMIPELPEDDLCFHKQFALPFHCVNLRFQLTQHSSLVS